MAQNPNPFFKMQSGSGGHMALGKSRTLRFEPSLALAPMAPVRVYTLSAGSAPH